jgi:aspartyl-tRNA(Asn)/glutamyl-tRNA(Gln) amidotransferase subunit C
MVTTAEVQKVADLAKLEFSSGELESLTGELNSILGYIDQLKELDVTNVAPLENLNEALEGIRDTETNALRRDELRECLPVEDALRNAPKSADNYFLVPKVLTTEVKTSAAQTMPEDDDSEVIL